MAEYHMNAGKQQEAEEKRRCATKGAQKSVAPSAKRVKHLTTIDKLAASVDGRMSKIESALEKMAELQLASMSAAKPAQEAQEENTPTSYVHSLQALENAGLKRVMAADLPNDRQLTYARGMMEKIKKQTRNANSNPFVYIDFSRKQFTGRPLTSAFSDEGPFLSKLKEEREMLMRDENPRPEPTSMHMWMKNMWAATLIAGITGYCDDVGGTQAFITYYHSLVSRLVNEKTWVVQRVDAAFRHHCWTLAANGVPFDLLDEYKKYVPDALPAIRKEVEDANAVREAGKHGGKHGSKQGAKGHPKGKDKRFAGSQKGKWQKATSTDSAVTSGKAAAPNQNLPRGKSHDS